MDVPLLIEFTPEESERLRERARLHGYDAAAYVRMALLDDEDDDETILAGLRTGCTEVLRGEEGTLDDLWEAVREDE